jgi:hypothetical protein
VWVLNMSTGTTIDFEHMPGDGPADETDVSLRAYLARLSDEHLAKYDPAWTDEQVIEWDGEFRSDGNLMLVCCERDVDISEFRRVLDKHLQYRRSVAKIA